MSLKEAKQLKAKGRDFPTLQNAVVDLHKLRFEGRKALSNILAAHKGQKCVIMDPQLADPLNLITCGTSIFKAGDVSKLKYLKWERFDASIQPNIVIYISRPEAELVKQIAIQIRSALGQGVQRGKIFAVYFVPSPTFICTQILREWQVYEDIATIGAMDMDLIPIDEDVLSLELPASFRQCFLTDDRSVLVNVANSIMKLQRLYGCISVLHSKGSRASAVVDMLLKTKAQQDAAGKVLGGGRMPQIDTCLILDRDADLVSPLLSPLTCVCACAACFSRARVRVLVLRARACAILFVRTRVLVGVCAACPVRSRVRRATATWLEGGWWGGWKHSRATTQPPHTAAYVLPPASQLTTPTKYNMAGMRP
jgi:hypothetical protein